MNRPAMHSAHRFPAGTSRLNSWIVIALLLAASLCGQTFTCFGSTDEADKLIEEMAKMVASGISEDIVIQFLATAPSVPRLSPDKIIELKKRGFSDRIIAAFLEHSAKAPAVTAPKPVEENRNRHFRVRATLRYESNLHRSFFRKTVGFHGADVFKNGVEMLWVLQAQRYETENGKTVAKTVQVRSFPREPICWIADDKPYGGALREVSPQGCSFYTAIGDPVWQEYVSGAVWKWVSYAEEPDTVFDVYFPERVDVIRVFAFWGGTSERGAAADFSGIMWNSKQVLLFQSKDKLKGSKSDYEYAYVEVQTHQSDNFEASVNVNLYTNGGKGEFETQMELTDAVFDNRDDRSISIYEERINQYGRQDAAYIRRVRELYVSCLPSKIF